MSHVDELYFSEATFNRDSSRNVCIFDTEESFHLTGST